MVFSQIYKIQFLFLFEMKLFKTIIYLGILCLLLLLIQLDILTKKIINLNK